MNKLFSGGWPFLTFVLIVILHIGCGGQPPNKILIIQDELPQIEALAPKLQSNIPHDVTVVDQSALPEDLSIYSAVLLYIHGELYRETEMAVINYTHQGGRLIVLHHSISSGKVKNEFYFDFLGIHLDNPGQSRNPVKPGGGYAWRNKASDGGEITLTLVNLDPIHYITNHGIQWPDTIRYTPSDFPSTEGRYPSLSLESSEIYLNHKFTDGREKTVLMGLKYFDDRNQTLFMQDRAGWIKKSGEGEIAYLMPGESVSDYEHPAITRMILNAIVWKQTQE